MIASAPGNFAEMIGMGVRLEEGVREGRLAKENVPTGNFEDEDQEMSMVKGWPQQQYPSYQPQFLQYQHQF